MALSLFRSLGLIASSLTLTAATASGSVVLNLDAPTFSGSPGDAITVSGTLTNPDSSGVYLNTASGFFSSSDLNFDLTDYFVLIPRTLGPGDTYSGPIFGILIDPTANPGDYVGSFTPQGGSTDSSFDDLATVNFDISVISTAAVPEPATAKIFGLLCCLLVPLRWRLRIPFRGEGRDYRQK
jgi:hypothetical protein